VDGAPEPDNLGERGLLLAWLAFHRDALAFKCAGLSAGQLVSAAAAPSDLSLLGLVRHMTEMERVYLVHALAGGEAPRLGFCAQSWQGPVTAPHPRQAVDRPSVHWQPGVRTLQVAFQHYG